MTIFAVMGAAKVMRRLAGSVPDVVYTSELKPGQALLISHLADETLGDKPNSRPKRAARSKRP